METAHRDHLIAIVVLNFILSRMWNHCVLLLALSTLTNTNTQQFFSVMCCVHSHRLFNFLVFSHSYSRSIWRWRRDNDLYALFLLIRPWWNQNNMHTRRFNLNLKRADRHSKRTHRIKRQVLSWHLRILTIDM